jgi:hypothetical protein
MRSANRGEETMSDGININLIEASIVMASVEDATSVDRSILIQDREFLELFKDLLNGRHSMQGMTDTLKEYVANHY